MNDIETRSYGFNLILKKYANFPWYLPLPCHFEHGWTAIPDALKSDLTTKKPLMLVFSKRRMTAWKKRSKIPVEIMGSPFVLYKKMMKIKRQSTAKGTVAFPSHSTYDLHAKFNVDEFCRALKELPIEYKPITICLFWIDYLELAKEYRKRGFRVVSAGPRFTNSLQFVRNFYKILSRHRYACSNEVGSYTFYAVDFNTPFFLVGAPPEVVNIQNRDVNIGSSARLTDYKSGMLATKLFLTKDRGKISKRQKIFVNVELGNGEALSAKKMNDIFWQAHKEESSFAMQIKYIYYSIANILLFNMPWTPFVIYLRNQIKAKG